MSQDSCPCASGKPYSECCEPYLLGRAKPETAALLMRSRYTAYALSSVDYIYETSCPRVQKEFDAPKTKSWSQSATWSGLEILREVKGSPDDENGIVEFVAHYTVNDKPFNHHEIATFEKHNGVWVFIDGRIIGTDPERRDTPKIGRNEPCPCGSGKKYKKCCAGKPAE